MSVNSIVSVFFLGQNTAGIIDTQIHTPNKITSAMWVEAPGSLSVDEVW